MGQLEQSEGREFMEAIGIALRYRMLTLSLPQRALILPGLDH